MRKFVAALVVCALFAGLVVCDAAQKFKASKRYKIAVIPKGTTHEFWKSVHAGAVKAGRELGVDIHWKGPLKEDDREAQIKVVEDFITRDVDGIVLAPLDDKALRIPVRNAVRAGIPVVIIDSGLKSRRYVSFVATDNRQGGKLGGKHLVKLLGGKGRVIMLRYQQGSASTANREKGFMDAVKGKDKIKVVSAKQYGGATRESAMKASESLLARYEKVDGFSIDGIFCPNESTTFGMLRALQDSKLAGKVKFVGFDASVKLAAALRKGEIDALVVQNPMRMGYLGVRTMVEHLEKKKVKKRVDTGVAVVTRENMDTPEMKELLSPDLDKWLKN